ncbi:hypothetical protein H6P81_006282 [Aristolochia fimbriata]|uniref:Uncharacterized protein n=1 Tax=Aristolochia fimbriata TaxID=158543 RepID=A0AAV7F1F8_ARIFI|nr:hypothetical protein H6P81_006282 [Aristolochia fimbriata]
MELRSGISLALLFLLLARANCSTREETVAAELSSGEVYEIDYRGPETHSYIPPPDLASGSSSKTPYTHRGKVHRKQMHG